MLECKSICVCVCVRYNNYYSCCDHYNTNYSCKEKFQLIIFCVLKLSSDSIQSEQTRPSSENLPFSISRLLSKPYDNNNKTTEKDILDAEHKIATHLANVGIPYSTASALYSYPLYSAGHVLRVPPQRAPLSWSLPPLHPAALAHQAVKDRLAGKFLYDYIIGISLGTTMTEKSELWKN